MSDRVLIIDDEEHICTVLSSYLEDQGYTPFSAFSLESAREQLKNSPLPDVILLDVMLKDGNGLIFLRELKRVPETEQIPVIMMSALRNRGQDRVAGLEYGADDYLGKPFDLQELKIRMERILKQKRKNQTGVVPFQISPPVSAVAPLPVTVAVAAEPDLSMLDEDDVPPVNLKHELGLLLLHPQKFFQQEISELDSRLGWVCLIGAALGFGLQIGIQDKSFGSSFVGSVAFFVGFVSVTAILSWVIQWVMGLKRIAIKFSEVWLFARVSFAPAAVAGILGVLYVLISNGRMGELTAGPLLMLPSQASSNTLGYILRRCDLFELWSVLLFGLGLATIFKTRKRFLLTWVLGSWISLVALYGFVRGLF